MCGIAGILSWISPPDLHEIEMMTASIAHRGPDASSAHLLESVAPPFAALGHSRLSVIDLTSASDQPLADHSGRYWIVFNGEIYNYAELRSELRDRNAEFRTRGDTEVVIEAYKAWGVNCLSRLNGMFAFALFDQSTSTLFAARDRLGEKPFYYSYTANRDFVFASDMSTVTMSKRVELDLNPERIGQFLSHGYIPGRETMFKTVKRLDPGHYMFVDKNGGMDVGSYWDLAAFFQPQKKQSNLSAATEELSGLLDDAVKSRMVSDVPVGAFLSGGVDSALAAEAMARVSDDPHTKTYTLGFSEKNFCEIDQAGATARHLGLEHESIVSERPSADDFLRIIGETREPLADTSIIPTNVLSKFARKDLKVCLSGDGGDEVFAGYETYVADRIHSYTRHLPTSLLRIAGVGLDAIPKSFGKVSAHEKALRFLAVSGVEPKRAHTTWRQYFSESEKRALCSPDFWNGGANADPFMPFADHFAAVSNCDPIDQYLFVDTKTWLADDILVKVDRHSMAHGLEVRVPFLDHRVVEFAASLPVSAKLRGLERKSILRRCAEHRLSNDILNRQKRGFNAPISWWLFGHLRDLGRDITLRGSIARYFNLNFVHELWSDHLAKRRDNGYKLFALIVLAQYLDSSR